MCPASKSTQKNNYFMAQTCESGCVCVGPTCSVRGLSLMDALRVHLRRGRRMDFIAVMSLFAASALPVPPPDRATLRRFRNIVADLGADLYVALVDGRLVGCVHVTYARQLTRPARATLDLLLVDPSHRRQGVGSTLLAFARTRAQRRGCGLLDCAVSGDPAARRLLQKAGWQACGEHFVDMLQAD